MPVVKFTRNLKRFYPDLVPVESDKTNIKELIIEVNDKFPGIEGYILDEHGNLRKHVQIFIGDKMIKDRTKLSDAVDAGDEVYIMQALSGG